VSGQVDVVRFSGHSFFFNQLEYNMPMTIKKYTPKNIPEHIKWQILSFQRVYWPDGFQDTNLHRDWIARESFRPVHFTLTYNKLLISHIAVISVAINHNGEIYNTKGLSGVFTYPSHRKKRHALSLVRECVRYIKQQKDADLALHTTLIKGLYEKAGFNRMEYLTVTYGNKRKPVIEQEAPYMLFLSEKAKHNRSNFETGTIYIGEHIW
jgi:predicted acetyltransferase